MSHTIQSIRLGDIGTKLELEVSEDNLPVDISTATSKDIKIRKPDLTTIIRPAVFSDTGVDGKLYILTIAGDLSIEGTYYIQAYVVMPSWDGHSTIGEFEVHENLG